MCRRNPPYSSPTSPLAPPALHTMGNLCSSAKAAQVSAGSSFAARCPACSGPDHASGVFEDARARPARESSVHRQLFSSARPKGRGRGFPPLSAPARRDGQLLCYSEGCLSPSPPPPPLRRARQCTCPLMPLPVQTVDQVVDKAAENKEKIVTGVKTVGARAGCGCAGAPWLLRLPPHDFEMRRRAARAGWLQGWPGPSEDGQRCQGG